MGVLKRAPATADAVTDPETAWEQRSGMSVEEGFANAVEAGVEIEDPDDLTRKEKAMLLMQFAFGILAASGQGLGVALGAAGLRSMGTWLEMRQARRGERVKREELGLEREAELEEARIRTEGKAPDTREVKRGDEIVTEEWDPATRTWREIGRGARYKDEGGAEGTALMKEVRDIKAAFGFDSLAEAYDYRLMAASARNADPDKLRNEVFKIALRTSYGDVDEAMRTTERAMGLLRAEPADAARMIEDESPKDKSLIRQLVEHGAQAAQRLLGGEGETTVVAPTVTGEIGGPPVSSVTPTTPLPLPDDPSGLRVGQTYQASDGRLGRWNGTDFDPVQ